MFEDIVSGAVGGAIGAIGAAIVFWAWQRRRVARRPWDTQVAAFREDEARSEGEQLATLREQVVERAVALNINVPVSASRNRVTFSNGENLTYIADLRAYQAAMRSGRVDPQRTFRGKPPTPLSRRGREWLEEWLQQHPL